MVESSMRFAVLGPARAWQDGLEVDLGAPQQRLILAVLLLREGTLATLDELVQVVWSGDPPKTAAGTIRTYVSRLRRLLSGAGSAIESLAGGYAMRVPADATDLGVFRRRMATAQVAMHNGDPRAAHAALTEALDLWHGTPLAGLPGEYAESQRTRLAQLRLSALSDRIALDLELGRHAEQAVELSVLVAENPLREGFRELYMLALYGSGRQADALATFRDIQRRLSAELGIGPGSELRALQQRILVADPTLVRTASAEPAVTRVPNQLPPAPSDFTGRQAETSDVVGTLVRADEVPVVAVTGMAGIGKTAFAVQVAHAVSTDFPDGQLYADLGATGDRPADPCEVLGGFLRAYGVPAGEVPRAYCDRVAMWRTVLSGRRVLLLLDDARDSAQVWDLLPATPGSAAIVTSRHRILDLPGSRWLKLDPLLAPDAMQLLERLTGAHRVRAEPAAAHQLLAHCSYVPYAIRLAGVRLLARRHWRVADVARRIDEEIRAAGTPFERGYRQLGAELARAFRLLAQPGDEYISVPEAAAILKLPEPDAEEMLESLADLHLIEPGRRGRYQYVGLIKRFARAQADNEAECVAV